MSTYLGIYLNDHLGGSTTGIELARRIEHEYEGTELGAFMAGLAEEIDADRRELLDIMGRLGAQPDRAKVAFGWIAEKAGRLKPNGHITGRSPLTPLVELEGLSLGIESKRLLWVALAQSVPEKVGPERLQDLVARAEQQRIGVERFRVEAAREVARHEEREAAAAH
jgi:hypothetical protein